MNNNKVGLLQDLHIGVRRSVVFRNYIKSYLIDFALPYFHSQGITDILQGGDVMDSRTSLLAKDRYWIVNELFPKLREYGMIMHCLSGNHDLGNRDDLEISWVDWIAAESKGCVVSYKKPQDLTFGSTTFSMIPWVCKANYDDVVEYIDNTEASVAIMHAELAGFKMAANTLCSEGTLDKELLSKYDKVLSSHFHQESRSANIFYLGMNYHLDWGSYFEDPAKGLYTYDTLTNELQFKENDPDSSLFSVIQYNYQDILENNLEADYIDKEYLENTLHLRDKVIRIEVVDRSNSAHYRSFLAAMRLVSCVNFTTLDLTREVETYEVDATPDKFNTDTLEVLLDKVEITEDIDNKSVAIALKKIYSDVVDKNNLI